MQFSFRCVVFAPFAQLRIVDERPNKIITYGFKVVSVVNVIITPFLQKNVWK